jgi:hypothetical protein
LEMLQMWLGQDQGRVVCYDKDGQPIATRVQAEQEKRQVEEEK